MCKQVNSLGKMELNIVGGRKFHDVQQSVKTWSRSANSTGVAEKSVLMKVYVKLHYIIISLLEKEVKTVDKFGSIRQIINSKRSFYIILLFLSSRLISMRHLKFYFCTFIYVSKSDLKLQY